MLNGFAEAVELNDQEFIGVLLMAVEYGVWRSFV